MMWWTSSLRAYLSVRFESFIQTDFEDLKAIFGCQSIWPEARPQAFSYRVEFFSIDFLSPVSSLGNNEPRMQSTKTRGLRSHREQFGGPISPD